MYITLQIEAGSIIVTIQSSSIPSQIFPLKGKILIEYFFLHFRDEKTEAERNDLA